MRERMKRQDYFDNYSNHTEKLTKGRRRNAMREGTSSLNQNNLLHQASYQRAKASYNTGMLTCLGLGALATGYVNRCGEAFAASRSGSRVLLSRIGGGVATAFVAVGSYLACNRLSLRARNHAEDTADQLKVGEDKLAELRYQECIKENVKPHKDKYDSVMRSRNVRLARIDNDYKRCGEFF